MCVDPGRNNHAHTGQIITMDATILFHMYRVNKSYIPRDLDERRMVKCPADVTKMQEKEAGAPYH